MALCGRICGRKRAIPGSRCRNRRENSLTFALAPRPRLHRMLRIPSKSSGRILIHDNRTHIGQPPSHLHPEIGTHRCSAAFGRFGQAPQHRRSECGLFQYASLCASFLSRRLKRARAGQCSRPNATSACRAMRRRLPQVSRARGVRTGVRVLHRRRQPSLLRSEAPRRPAFPWRVSCLRSLRRSRKSSRRVPAPMSFPPSGVPASTVRVT